jgi:hypothetical protein
MRRRDVNERIECWKSDLKIPKSATEAEEAKWRYENDHLIFQEFQKAAKEGRLGRGGIRRMFAEKGIPFKEPKPTPTATIRLDPEDIAKARAGGGAWTALPNLSQDDHSRSAAQSPGRI